MKFIKPQPVTLQSDKYNTVVVVLGRGQTGILYQPSKPGGKSGTAVLVMHSDANYLTFSAGAELAARGYTVFCTNVGNPSSGMFMKLQNVKTAVDYLRSLDRVEKVILLGHSGGATLMTAYQNLAENGVGNFSGEKMLIRFPDKPLDFSPADGVILPDPNWGNGAMTLFSIDPAVVTEGDGRKLDPELDLFNPANGFDPNGSHYSDVFIAKFQKAQGERNNRVIDAALARAEIIDDGGGDYADDEPFIVTGAASGFMNNKLFAQDISLMSRTKEARTLLRAGGAETVEIVRTTRQPANNRSFTGMYRDGILVTSVKTFLDSLCVRVTEDYRFDADGVYGVDWQGCYSCTTGNVRGVSAPLLVMGMTAGWEFASAEAIYNNAASLDKTLAYVEGASHMFTTARECERFPGQFGDTQKTTYDYIDRWLSERVG